MNSFRDVIDAFTTGKLAALFALPESHVRTMRARDSIPPLYWPLIIENAPEKLAIGLTYDLLRSFRAKKTGGRKGRVTQQPSTAPKAAIPPSPFPTEADA